MYIEMREINQYINRQQTDAEHWYERYCGKADFIADNRQEVCLRLFEECERYRDFPLWNQALVITLFPYIRAALKDLILMPIVGSDARFDAAVVTHEQQVYLLVDLLNVADYTQSVKQMCYILHNLCHIHLLRYVLEQHFTAEEGYLNQLEHRFFCEGLIQYLSWNENHRQYQWQKEQYEKRKEQAFEMLYAAMQSTDETLQDKILQLLKQASLWNRFTDIAGMFYCDDLYHENGIEALQRYVNTKGRNIIRSLF